MLAPDFNIAAADEVLAQFRTAVLEESAHLNDDLAAEYEEEDENATPPELMPLRRNAVDLLPSTWGSALDDDSDDGEDEWSAYAIEQSPETEVALLQQAPAVVANANRAPPARRETAATSQQRTVTPSTPPTVPPVLLLNVRKNVSLYDDKLDVRACLSPPWKEASCSVSTASRKAAAIACMLVPTTNDRAGRDEDYPETEVPVHLIDGSCVTVTARAHDSAAAVVASVASRAGIADEHFANLSLYALVDERPEHRITPTTRVSALEAIPSSKSKLVLAVRLFTPYLMRVARRGLHQRARPSDAAMANLLYSQIVANVMSGSLPLPTLLEPRRPRRFPHDDFEDDDISSDDDDPLTEFLRGHPEESHPFDGAASSDTSVSSTTLRRDSSSSDDFEDSGSRKTAETTTSAQATALRFGALRLWSRAGDLIETPSNRHLGIVAAATHLVQKHGPFPFLPPPIRREEEETKEEGAGEKWKSRLLTELDFLLKVQVTMSKQQQQLSSRGSFSESDGITIEVFDGIEEKKEGATMHTITVERLTSSSDALPSPPVEEEQQQHHEAGNNANGQQQPVLSSTQRRQRRGGPGAAISLLGASCFFRLATWSPLFGATVFPCWAHREAVSSKKKKKANDDDDETPHRPSSTNSIRLLSISKDGVAFVSEKSPANPLETIAMAALRRWICDVEEQSLVKFESERDIIELHQQNSRLSVESADLAASKARSRLRRTLRRLSSDATLNGDEHDQNGAATDGHHQAADVDDDDDEASAANQGNFVDWMFSPGRRQHSMSGVSSSEGAATETTESSPFSLSGDEDGDDEESDDEDLAPCSLEYHVQLVGHLARSTYQASEIVTLLDDYCQYSHLEKKPKCRYESVFSSAAAAADSASGSSAQAKRRKSFNPTEESEEEKASDEVLGGRPTVYKALVSAVVRPPRFVYETGLLGPSSFDFAGSRFFRHDLVLRNKDGLKLHCSFWRPVAGACANGNHLESMLQFKSPKSSPSSTRTTPNSVKSTSRHQSPPQSGQQQQPPVVVFTHANSASRVQACTYLSVVLSLGYSLFAFDCAGSGVSEGEHVSLGWNEAMDLLVVLAHLKSLGHTQIAVWGHSMGAAAAIYYQSFARGKPWPKLDVCVLDSPYSDFRILADHLVRGNAMLTGHHVAHYLASFTVAQTALQLVLDSIDASVTRIVNVSPLRDLSPISKVKHCTAPALFLQARNDKIISLAHVEDLANKYAGNRKLAIIDGTHSSPRNKAARKFVALYLKKILRPPPNSTDLRYPSSARARDGYLEALPWQRHRTSLPHVPSS